MQIAAEPKVEERGPLNVVGMLYAGTFDDLVVEMPDFWRGYHERRDEIADTIEAGICYDIALQDERHDVYVQCVSVEVADFPRIPPGMLGMTVPAGKWAIFTHCGGMDAVAETYRSIFAWLEEAPWAFDSARRRYERYDTRFVPGIDPRERDSNACEIFVPVRV